MRVSCSGCLQLLLPLSLSIGEDCRVVAYSPGLLLHSSQNVGMSMSGMPHGNGEHKCAADSPTTRRGAIRRLATFSLLPGAAAMIGGVSMPQEAAGKGTTVEAGKEWISGKGAQPKGSDDKTGTRKESKYLRCLSNCLADCQKPTYGPERDREECLQLCQDECCTSYEQCTYTVTQNR